MDIHASHSQGHKYYFSKNNKINFIRPNKILVTGKIAKEKFIQIGYKAEDILILGSSKYHEIKDFKVSFKTRRPKILFMCGVGLEIVNFAKLLNKESNLFEDFELVIRRILIHGKTNKIMQKKYLKVKIFNTMYQN